jgi:hypothetical protein
VRKRLRRLGRMPPDCLHACIVQLTTNARRESPFRHSAECYILHVSLSVSLCGSRAPSIQSTPTTWVCTAEEIRPSSVFITQDISSQPLVYSPQKAGLECQYTGDTLKSHKTKRKQYECICMHVIKVSNFSPRTFDNPSLVERVGSRMPVSSECSRLHLSP